MTEHERMLEDGYTQSYRDKDVYTKDGRPDLLAHPDDPNFVKELGSSGHSWKRYDADDHDK